MAMSKSMNRELEREDIAMLLPWYATGRLDDADAALVEASLADDPALLLQLELAHDECDESLLGNEAIGPRPARNADRLLAELERREAPVASAISALWDRIVSFVCMPPAGAVRWAAAAATIVIVAQAGILGTMLVRQPAGYAPASGATTVSERSAVALVAFVPGASTSAVVDLLAAHDMSILQGPDAGGSFTVRLGPETMSDAARQEKIAALKSRGDVVAFVLPLR